MRTSFRKRLLSAIILAPLVIFAVSAGGLPTTLLLALCAGLAVYEWDKMSALLPDAQKIFLYGLGYLFVCFMALMIVRFGFGAMGAFFLLSLLLSVWVSDIGAYVFGKTFRGPKLAPVISPNKTWAGLFGACFCCGLTLLGIDALVASFNTNDAFHIPNYVAVFIFGCVMGAVAQAGDLLVSIFKRKSGLKDTGSLIPGHGGILDRIDALLLAAVFYLAGLIVVVP